MITSSKPYIEKVQEMYPDVPKELVRKIITKYVQEMYNMVSSGESFVIQRKKFFVKILHPRDFQFTDEYRAKRTCELVRRRKLEDIILKNYV